MTMPHLGEGGQSTHAAITGHGPVHPAVADLLAGHEAALAGLDHRVTALEHLAPPDAAGDVAPLLGEEAST